MTKIVYNSQQQEAIERMLEHEASQNPDFTLIGWAGTGKTTCLRGYVERSRYGASKICVSAPTHAAKEQIIKSTGLQGKTLHSLLGLRPNLDLADININNLKFQQIEKPSVDKYNVIIIDECSMINQSLYYLLIEEAKHFKTKLIFVGDPLQLPPINEQMSVTFLHSSNRYFLTKIMRQDSNNFITKLTESIRFELIKMLKIPQLENLKDILPDNFVSSSQLLREAKMEEVINKNTTQPDYIGVFVTSDPDRYDKSVEFFFSNKSELPSTRYCAFYNDKVDSFNSDVRNYIFNNPKFLELNDSIMGYKTVIKEDFEVAINSKEYKIVNIEKIFDDNYKLYFYQCKLSSINNNKLIYNTVKIVAPESYNVFIQHYNEKLSTALENRRLFPKFYEFIEEYLLIENIPNTYKEIYSSKPSKLLKTFGFAYASTIHKFQGRTVNYIFVNARNINQCPDIFQRYQLLYVAISRARKGAFIYI